MEKVFFAFPYSLGEDYRMVARRACSDLGLVAVFGDEVRQADALIKKLCQSIDECRLSFFDITGLNPNVLIELGIAFSTGKKTFVFYDEKRHKDAAGTKAAKELIPSDLQGHERFTYRTLEDLDRELRQSLRAAMGIGTNSAYDLKEKIRKMLRNNPQPIRKIVEAMGAPENDVQDALAAMRFERRVDVQGRGGGAKWKLVSH